MAPALPLSLPQNLTAEKFWDWAARPENHAKQWELEEGRVVEVPSPGEWHGVICSLVCYFLGQYFFRRGRGYVCSNRTGILVRRRPDTVRGADVMLFDLEMKAEELSRRFTERVPALVVEVLSPSDRPGASNRRMIQYLRRGIPIAWLVDPEEKNVTVYHPGQEVQVLEVSEELIGDTVLPDLRIPVASLFTLPTPPAAP